MRSRLLYHDVGQGHEHRHVGGQHEPQHAQQDEPCRQAVEPERTHQADQLGQEPGDRIRCREDRAMQQEVHRCEGGEQHPRHTLGPQEPGSGRRSFGWVDDAIQGDERGDVEEQPHRREGPVGRGDGGVAEGVVEGEVSAESSREGTDGVRHHEDEGCVPPAESVTLKIHGIGLQGLTEMLRQPQRQCSQRPHGIGGTTQWHHRHVADIQPGGSDHPEILIHNRISRERGIQPGPIRHPQTACGVMHSSPTETLASIAIPNLLLVHLLGPGGRAVERELGHDPVGDRIQHRPDLRGVLLPAGQGAQTHLGEMVHPTLVTEDKFRHIGEGRGGLELVVVVEAVGEAELDVHACRAPGPAGRPVRLSGVVVA